MAKNSIYNDNGTMFGSKSKNNKSTKKPQATIIMPSATLVFSYISIIIFIFMTISINSIKNGDGDTAAKSMAGLTISMIFGIPLLISTALAIISALISMVRKALNKK